MILADVVVNNPIVNSAMDFVLEVQTLYGGTSPPKTHGLYHFMARMISLRVDVKPLEEDFDLLGWAENGLDHINVTKFGKFTSCFVKNAPKTLILPDVLTEFLAMIRDIADRRKAEAKAATPDKPTNADNGMALPVAAASGETTDEKATFMPKFSTDTSFRAVVMGALQTLSEKS